MRSEAYPAIAEEMALEETELDLEEDEEEADEGGEVDDATAASPAPAPAPAATAATTPPQAPEAPSTSTTRGGSAVLIKAALAVLTIKVKRFRREEVCDPFVSRMELLPAPPAASPKPMLTGVTFAVEDSMAVEGHVTAFGNPDWASVRAPESAHAPAVTRCLSGGAKGIGKTVLGELACGLDGESVHYAKLSNPAAPRCAVGGAASGAAVAVARGLVDFVLCADTVGGARVPAAYCGVHSFRPTTGKVPTRGLIPVAKQLDTVSWVAKDAPTLKKVGDVLLGLSNTKSRKPLKVIVAADALCACGAEAATAAAEVTAALSKLVPVTGRGEVERTTVDLGAFLLNACPTLKQFAPAEASPAGDELPGLDALKEAMHILQGYEFWTNHGKWLQDAQPHLGDVASEHARSAAVIHAEINDTKLTAPRVIQLLLQLMGELKAAMADLLRNNVLVLPTVYGAAPKSSSPMRDRDNYHRVNLQLLSVASMSGCPQVSIPVGGVKGARGPVGVSLMTASGDDQLLLHTAVALEPKLEVRGSSAIKQESKEQMAEAAKEKGNDAFKEGKYEEAVAHYTKAVEADKTMVSALNNRAMAQLKLGNYTQTEEDCNLALKLDPKNAKALLRRGTSRALQSMYKEALDDFEAVLLIEPNNKSAQLEINRMRKMTE